MESNAHHNPPYWEHCSLRDEQAVDSHDQSYYADSWAQSHKEDTREA